MATTKKTTKKTPAKKKAAKRAPTKRKAAKKAPAKTPAKKGAKKKPSTRKVDATLSRADRIRSLEALFNKPGKPPILRRASDSGSSYLLRRPTGITSLDIAMAGGFPASSPVMITGPDGAGKDYLLYRMCAEVQRIYGNDFAMAIYPTEFKLDKPFMRDMCGLKIKASPEELDELDIARDNAGLPPLTGDERLRYTEEVGHIAIIENVESAEQGFDAVIECVATNAFQIVAVNSVGFLQTLAKIGTDSYEQFAQQRNEAILLSKFMPDLALTMNSTANMGERNETLVVLIDQVRSKDQAPRPMKGRTPQDKDKYRPARQVWAMKHGLSIVLEIHKGKRYYDETDKCYIGRKIPWELTKGKLGTHDGIKGEYNFFYNGGADVIGDLLSECVRLEVVEVRGSHYVFEDEESDLSFKAHGKHTARRYIRDSEDLWERLRYLCLRASGIVYRHA